MVVVGVSDSFPAGPACRLGNLHPSHWKEEAGVVSSSLSFIVSGATQEAMPGSTKSRFTHVASQRREQSQYSWFEPRALRDRAQSQRGSSHADRVIPLGLLPRILTGG